MATIILKLLQSGQVVRIKNGLKNIHDFLMRLSPIEHIITAVLFIFSFSKLIALSSESVTFYIAEVACQVICFSIVLIEVLYRALKSICNEPNTIKGLLLPSLREVDTRSKIDFEFDLLTLVQGASIAVAGAVKKQQLETFFRNLLKKNLKSVLFLMEGKTIIGYICCIPVRNLQILDGYSIPISEVSETTSNIILLQEIVIFQQFRNRHTTALIGAGLKTHISKLIDDESALIYAASTLKLYVRHLKKWGFESCLGINGKEYLKLKLNDVNDLGYDFTHQIIMLLDSGNKQEASIGQRSISLFDLLI